MTSYSGSLDEKWITWPYLLVVGGLALCYWGVRALADNRWNQGRRFEREVREDYIELMGSELRGADIVESCGGPEPATEDRHD